MRLETLSLGGVLRFRDPLTIDFRELPAGLIALVGGNGKGKTSVLEAWIASVYRKLPSRKDRALLDVAHDKHSFIESTFAIDGVGLYRARVALNGPARTSEAVLTQETPAGPAILTDGKVTTFDAYVTDHFPPLPVVLASSFAAQNREGSFVLQKAKARKELFSTLLGLEHLEAMGETAAQAGRLIDERRQRLLTERGVLERDAGPEVLADLERSLARAALDLDEATASRDAYQELLGRLEQELATVAVEATRHAEAAVTLRALEAEGDALTQETEAIGSERSTVVSRGSDTAKDLDRALTRRLTDLDERIQNNQTLLGQADEIRAAAATEQEASDGLRATDATIVQTEGVEQGFRDTARVLDDRERARASLRRDIDQATQDKGTLGQVPCHGGGAFADCKFLVDAQAAAAQIPVITRDLAEYAGLDQNRETHAAGLAVVTADVANLRALRLQLQERQADAQPLAARLPSLEAAEQRVLDLSADKRAAQATAKQQQSDLATALSNQLDALNERAVRLTTRAGQIDRDSGAHRRVLAETVNAERRRCELTDQRTGIGEDLQNARAQIERGQAKREALDAERARLVDRQAEIAMLTTRLDAQNQDLREWRVLAAALGRDGLPTLEIAAAGPTVSSYCNDLLASCFGTRFTVELVTQAAKKAGGLKEVFTVRIFDNDRGGEPRDIADLSGGEQVIVDEALKNAIAIYANTRSAMPIRTCWRDETTGALDVENADRYLTMLRRVQTLGGFHQILFVTHNPEAAQQADAQLRLRDGAVDVVLPPYTAAA